MLVGSALTHACYGLWLSRAYAHADMSLVYPIARSTPAFVPLIAVPLLGESVSPLGALGIALVVLSLWAVTADGRLNARVFLSRKFPRGDFAALEPLCRLRVHAREGPPSREEYLRFAAKYGVFSKHQRVIVPQAEVLSVRRLGELPVE